jgi:hypothetical protein
MAHIHDQHVFVAVTTAGTSHVLKALTQSVDTMVSTAAQVAEYIGLSDHPNGYQQGLIKAD